MLRHGYQVNKGIKVEDGLKLFNRFIKIIGVPKRIKRIRKIKGTTMFLYKEFYNKMSKEARFNLRIKMIEEYNKGKSISQISKEYGVSRNTLRKWIKRYKEKEKMDLKNFQENLIIHLKEPLKKSKKKYWNYIKKLIGKKKDCFET